MLTLTLNRPEKKNALTRARYQALGGAIDGAAGDPDVRCIVIQGEGDAFTAGNDLGDFAAINQTASSSTGPRHTNPMLTALARATTRAFSMFVLGEAVNAQTALAWGLANAVCPREERRDAAGLAARMDVEGGHFAAQLASAEAKEAFAAFAKNARQHSPRWNV